MELLIYKLWYLIKVFIATGLAYIAYLLIIGSIIYIYTNAYELKIFYYHMKDRLTK